MREISRKGLGERDAKDEKGEKRRKGRKVGR